MFSVISTLLILISILYSSYGYRSVKRAKDKNSGCSSHFLILFVRSGTDTETTNKRKQGNLFVSLEKKVRKLFCCLLKIDRFTLLKKCTIKS